MKGKFQPPAAAQARLPKWQRGEGRKLLCRLSKPAKGTFPALLLLPGKSPVEMIHGALFKVKRALFSRRHCRGSPQQQRWGKRLFTPRIGLPIHGAKSTFLLPPLLESPQRGWQGKQLFVPPLALCWLLYLLGCSIGGAHGALRAICTP